MPSLREGFFGGSLLYTCDHDENGAMALMINQPLEIYLSQILSHLGIPIKKLLIDFPILAGGPVSPNKAFILHTEDQLVKNSLRLGDGLALSCDLEMLTLIANGEGPEKFIITLGYSGWGSGQIENEIKQNSWLTCPADQKVIFDMSFDKRLMAAAENFGINFSLIAREAGYA